MTVKNIKRLAKTSLLFKLLSLLVALILILQVFPGKTKFKYEFRKGELWQHENLYAPFDFPLKKTDEQIKAEERHITEQSTVYYRKDTAAFGVAMQKYQQKQHYYFDRIPMAKAELLRKRAHSFLVENYQRGILLKKTANNDSKIAVIDSNNQITELPTANILSLESIKEAVKSYFSQPPYDEYQKEYYDLFFDILTPNLVIDQNFTQKNLRQNLKEIVYTRGWVSKGKIIIAKGELVEGEKYNMLSSLKDEYESQTWSQNNYNWSQVGYYFLVAVVLVVMLLYLKIYEKKVYKNNLKLSVILLNMLSMILLVGLMARHFPDYIYLVPIAMMVLILKSFFDLRTVLFMYISTILITGFIVPNSFQFVFIQIIAAMTIILTPKSVHYRLSSFISAGLITGAYLLIYIAFHVITEGTLKGIDISLLTLFILNGIGILFSQPFTYIYERTFGLVSDVSLLELSDTNSKLLRQLSEKAPGTFQHSMQVANLAEAAAAEIGANTLLVRVGALYHDIGKMENPLYFIENQKTSLNPHDQLTPSQSAKVIIKHVTDGVELAHKNKLPERIIDFIRTHHGRSLTYYFYRKELDTNPDAKEEDFRYPGPIPFSKETAILMMADSVEAATKSLKNPTYEALEEFVERIIKKQLEDNQFANSDISFKEIERIKKVFKSKLINIYHVRIAYPE
nr:HDIG domain-containing metalloprotein [uncultured Capnocytophaga sp.]